MSHPTLSAVPSEAAAQRPDPREVAFRRRVMESMETLDGPAATDQIVRLYHGDVTALKSHLQGAMAESSQLAATSRMHFEMLKSVQESASHGYWEQAKLAAECSTLRTIVENVVSLTDRADSGMVDASLLRSALSVVPADPIHMPTVLALYPNGQYRAGQFIAVPEGGAVFVWPFAGWALVDRGPGAAGTIEPVFIVQDRALCQSMVEIEKRVTFQRFLPHVYASVAA